MMLDRIIAALDRALTFVLMGLVALMAGCISGEILLNAIIQPLASHWMASADSTPQPALEGLMRFIANASSPINTASQTLLVWIGILGSALAFRMRKHLGVDALVRLYPPKARLILDHISTALVCAFSLAVMVIGGWLVALRAFELGSKMPGIESVNRGWFYLVLLIAGALNLVYSVYHFLHPQPVAGWGDDEGEHSQ